MVDQLNAFAGEVTRVARGSAPRASSAGSPGARRGGHVEGSHRQRELDGEQLDTQVRNIADVATAIANGDLSKKVTVDVSGEILQLKQTINTMVDQLNAFAGEVTRVRARSAPRESSADRPSSAASRARGRISPTASTRWRATSRGRCETSPRSRPRSPAAICRARSRSTFAVRFSSSKRPSTPWSIS